MCAGDKRDSQDAGLPNRIPTSWLRPSSGMHASQGMRAVGLLRVLASKNKKLARTLRGVIVSEMGYPSDIKRLKSSTVHYMCDRVVTATRFLKCSVLLTLSDFGHLLLPYELARCPK